jgi:multiple sugar transport system ATP-binding protein
VNVTDGSGTVTLGSQSVALHGEVFAKRPGLKRYGGRQVILGIRPEDFEDAELATTIPADQRIQTQVMLTESLGSEIMVHFKLDAQTVDSGDPDAIVDEKATANAVGRFNPRSHVRIGDKITVAVTTENLHFFDAETREAIWD